MLLVFVHLHVACLRRYLSEADARLEFERKRREGLEAEMDQLRKQLQQAMSQLRKYQAVSSSSPSPHLTPEHPPISHTIGPKSKRKTPKKLMSSGGGAFIKIGHV